ncbi:MAG TPA: hypothetical protein VH252_05300, partial [Chthoniobacterales bacterium]|nr:hypothetical protein [Chthoniobacterales bacterium]
MALAILIIAGSDPRLEGDDSPGSESDGAQVEVNGARRPRKAAQVKIDLGDSKDVSFHRERTRRKNVVEIDLADSKDATVEIVREREGAHVEINGYRVKSRLKPSRRYLFGQEQILDPPLPPSEFNPDPAGGNLIEPIEPPDLFPPILPTQTQEYTGPAPRSLGLPRRGVREMEPERHKLEYEDYPDSAAGLGLLPGSEPVPNRWFIGFGQWQRYADPRTETPYQTGRLRFWHPYLQSKLKGDAPIYGQDIFLNLTLNDFFQFEARRLPTPSGVSAARPNSSEFFGRSEQVFFSNDFSIGVDLFKGETAFKPVVWALRFLLVANQNYIRVKENNALDPDPRGPGYTTSQPQPTFPVFGDPTSGLGPGLTRLPGDLEGSRYTTRTKYWYSLQEAFGEVHIRDLTNNYDFLSSRFGIQPFVSDFRGFIFNDSNLGLRLFGNYDNNRWQYNFIAFDMREKDTYSDLNKFDDRDQRVFVLNVFRQDFLTKGYTAQLSFHANLDERSRHYDQNDFITRPAPIGAVRDHFVHAYYLGWAGDGHIGRLNISHALYEVLGNDEFNGIAQRRVDINAQMAALELSIDKDWLRFRLSGFYASGDSNPRDSDATGFDTIFDKPFFVGGPFSYFVHQGFNLGGTSVNFKQRDSLVIDLRTSKSEGQSNFVNPGTIIAGFGTDADITPKLKAFLNVNYIWMADTEVIRDVLFTNRASNEVGLDCSLGVQYRPLLTNNIIITAGVGFLIPGQGYKDIYRANTNP